MGKPVMVRASLAGAILANLLLALGVAFLLGGIRYHQQGHMECLMCHSDHTKGSAK